MCRDCRRGIHRRCEDCGCRHRSHRDETVEQASEPVTSRPSGYTGPPARRDNDDAFVTGLIVGGVFL